MSQKILIVDDEQEVLEILKKKITAVGYAVHALNEGKDIVDEAKAFAPDLILIDIVLPDIDGADAVKMLQEDDGTKGIPVLFISGMVGEDESQGFSTVTVSGKQYKAISKPFDFKKLFEQIKRMIG